MSDLEDVSEFKAPPTHPRELALVLEAFATINSYTTSDLYESFEPADLELLLEIMSRPNIISDLLASDGLRQFLESRINRYKSALTAALKMVAERKRPRTRPEHIDQIDNFEWDEEEEEPPYIENED